MIYENRKKMLFEVLSSDIYCIIKKYVCDDYLYFQQNKICVADKLFLSKTYNDISLIGN